MKNSSDRKKGYLVVFGGFLVQLTLGNFYIYGSVADDVIAYMNNCSHSKNITQDQSIWIPSSIAFGIGAAVSLGGFIDNSIGPSLTVLIGGWLMSINICLLYFTLKSYLSIVIISYGLLVGIGTGIAYGSTLRPACTWFPERKGLVIGLVISGIGVFYTGFEAMYFQIPIIRLVSFFNNTGLSMFVCKFMEKNKKTIFMVNQMNKDEYQVSLFIMKSNNKPRELKPYQLLLEFDFWILWITCLINVTSIIMVSVLFKEYGIVLNLNPTYLSNISIAVPIFHCSGKIFFGYLIDKKSFKFVMVIINLLTSFFIGTLILLQMIHNGNLVTYMYGFWIGMLNFLSVGSYSVYPVMCARLFGMKYFISNYGMIYTSCSFSSVVIMASASIIFAKTSSYIITCISGFVLSILGIGVTLLFRGRSLIVY